MAKKIIVQDTEITVSQMSGEDYISLTDMMKAKDGDFFFHNWLRNRNTIEFLGIWGKVHNPDFNYVEFDTFRNQAGLNSFKIVSKNLQPRQFVGIYIPRSVNQIIKQATEYNALMHSYIDAVMHNLLQHQ